MKSALSGNHIITFISRRSIAAIAGALGLSVFSLAAAPDLRAETPPDQIKAAGAIALTTDLLDKMDEFITAVNSDDAAKKELAAVGKDPSITPENWGSVISAKCPKTVELFEEAELTPDDFGKAIFAIMAVSMSEDLAKSEDKIVKANAAFVTANKDRVDKVFGGFMMLGEPGPSSSP
jgi:hypothetical protein